MESQPLSINELEDTFFPLKVNQSPDYNEVSLNVIKKCFGELCEPSKVLWIVKGFFPDDQKIA